MQIANAPTMNRGATAQAICKEWLDSIGPLAL